MEYTEFFEQFEAAYDDWSMGRVRVDAAAAEIERLRALVPQLDTEVHRRRAEFALEDFARETSPESRDRVRRASAVLGAALEYEGPIEEHIARAEQGIRDITSIGTETDDESERFSIISMNGALATLVADLKALTAKPDRTS